MKRPATHHLIDSVKVKPVKRGRGFAVTANWMTMPHDATLRIAADEFETIINAWLLALREPKLQHLLNEAYKLKARQ